MALDTIPSSDDIRTAKAQNPRTRDRDLADKLGISEAQLVGAHVGHGAVRLVANPDGVMQAACTLGPVMALTRNDSCVSEIDGQYDNYHPGPHAGMVLNDRIDLRIFPKHWVSAFAVTRPTESGVRCSLQVFDAAGDAVHKIFLRDDSDMAAWTAATETLRHGDQSQTLTVEPRAAPEVPKSSPEKADALRDAWARMTDTHQFFGMVSRLKMNRLGAYRIVGAPFARQLQVAAVDDLLNRLRDAGIEVMIFVGNRGCIQIYSGPLQVLRPMGPWQNVMDPGFNLHLRLDHVAEVWAVDKPTKRGAAVSVEAFDAEGGLIFQMFGIGAEGRDSRLQWRTIVAELPGFSGAGSV